MSCMWAKNFRKVFCYRLNSLRYVVDLKINNNISHKDKNNKANINNIIILHETYVYKTQKI